MEPRAAELVNRGVDCWQSGNLDQAIALYSEAIAIDPTASDAYYNRGTAHGEKGDHDAAIADYTTALEFKPGYAAVADIYYNRALAYGKKGKDELAIADYTQAIANNPQFAKAYYNRGIALERAHELNPRFSEAFNNRGAAYISKRDLARAIPDFARAAELNPTATAPRHNLEVARANKERGTWDVAGKIVIMQI